MRLAHQAQILFDVPPSAFVPPPKVTSSVVRLVPRPEPLPCRVRALETVTGAAFGQRRKMLRQSLKAATPDPAACSPPPGSRRRRGPRRSRSRGFVAMARVL